VQHVETISNAAGSVSMFRDYTRAGLRLIRSPATCALSSPTRTASSGEPRLPASILNSEPFTSFSDLNIEKA